MLFRSDALVSWQGYWTTYHCASSLYGLYYPFGRFVEQIMIVRFKLDSDLLVHCFYLNFYVISINLPGLGILQERFWLSNYLLLHSARTS